MGDVVSGKDKESGEKSWQLAGGSWQSQLAVSVGRGELVVAVGSWQSVNNKSLRKSAGFLCGTSARNKNI